MTRSRKAFLAGGIAMQPIGAALLLATCVGGRVAAETELARDLGGAWRGRVAAPLAVGSTVALDLFADYDDEGVAAMEVVMSSASGARTVFGDRLVENESGRTTGRFVRIGSFTPLDPGPWTAEVTIGPGDLPLTRARAVMREGAIDGLVPGVIVMTLGLLVGLAAIPWWSRR